MMKKVIIAGLIFVVAVGAYLGLLLTTAESGTALEFETYEEAVSGDAREDHWIPAFMPESATQISVRYGVSPSFLRLEFLTVPDERVKMLGDFRLVTDPVVAERAIGNALAFDWAHDPVGPWSVYVPMGSSGKEMSTAFLLLAADEVSVRYMVD